MFDYSDDKLFFLDVVQKALRELLRWTFCLPSSVLYEDIEMFQREVNRVQGVTFVQYIRLNQRVPKVSIIIRMLLIKWKTNLTTLILKIWGLFKICKSS